MKSQSEQTPEEILADALQRVAKSMDQSSISSLPMREHIDFICRCLVNRAGVRLLMACMLAKLHNPIVDPRKPYTEIGTKDSFSGRTYDERYLTKFITQNRLPVNATTAFLTPTLRNIGQPLTTKRELVGRPRELYSKTLIVLDAVANNRLSAADVLVESIRVLLLLRNEKLERMASLLSGLERSGSLILLSSEAIVDLVGQHLACKNASRLPVLIVAAIYDVINGTLAERRLPLRGHNAADLQTGAFGDVEICLATDDAVLTAYEMKLKRVTIDDIDVAVTKIAKATSRINNYLFVTTEPIDVEVAEYAKKFYDETGGTEISILDCLGYLRHFLHLFHRARTEFLNKYQQLVLAEQDSAVSQALKEAF